MAVASILGGTLGSFLVSPERAQARPRRRLPAWRELNPAGGSAPAFFDVFGPSSATSGFPANQVECHGATSAWTNYGPDHTSAAFYRYQDVVHLKGIVTGGVTGTPNFWNGCPIFFLPEGYRPAKNSNFSVVTSDTANPRRIEIRPNGGVYCLAGGTGFISLDGITFRKGQQQEQGLSPSQSSLSSPILLLLAPRLPRVEFVCGKVLALFV